MIESVGFNFLLENFCLYLLLCMILVYFDYGFLILMFGIDIVIIKYFSFFVIMMNIMIMRMFYLFYYIY